MSQKPIIEATLVPEWTEYQKFHPKTQPAVQKCQEAANTEVTIKNIKVF